MIGHYTPQSVLAPAAGPLCAAIADDCVPLPIRLCQRLWPPATRMIRIALKQIFRKEFAESHAKPAKVAHRSMAAPPVTWVTPNRSKPAAGSRRSLDGSMS